MTDVSLFAVLQTLTSPSMLLLLLAGTCVGIFFGIIPGLGGKLGMVFLIPFTIGMDPLAGAVFLVAMHSVVHTRNRP
jgi:putative tricarboxylic transport membrane protein